MYTQPVTQIKKRSGQIVDFEPPKIHSAMQKAFGAQKVQIDSEKLQEMANNVAALISMEAKTPIPSVEFVQNMVEQVLMTEGYYDVARSYIIYRYEHTKQREELKRDVLERVDKEELYVIKRDGQREKFSFDKLKDSLRHAIEGLDTQVDLDAIVNLCRSELYDDIPTEDIERSLILTTRALIEQDPVYSKIASRLLLNSIYKEVVGIQAMDFSNLEESCRRAFVQNTKRAVEMGKLDARMLLYDLDELASYIDFSRDHLFEYLGLQTLYDRYFISDPKAKCVLESPQSFWMRIAMGLALNETDKEQKVKTFYDTVSNLYYVPSTPTLFHAGTTHPQLSSCYITTVSDSLDHIFKCIGDNAQLAKWSGGIGNDWTNLRATGAFIKGTGVESQGVVPFLKVANDTTVAINRSGRRRGATVAYLETWHADIYDFLELRKNTGDERRRTHDMNTANWIPDLFMKRVREDGDWTLFSPDETKELHHIYGHKFEERYKAYERMAQEGKIHLSKTVKAKDVWKKMLTMLFETGHPWVTFKDPCNVRSPQDHVGVIHSSNLCTEITLNTSEEETAVCNLGSINLARHMKGKALNTELVAQTIKVAMRMLDNVIDLNFYPTKEGQTSNRRHRPVGLGVMGFQDALYFMDVPFDSDEAVEFADHSMEVISYHAIMTSSELAKERGAYPSYEGSKWSRDILPIDTMRLLEEERGEEIPISRKERMDWEKVRNHIKEFGMRNSNTMAIAPTATIANISGCTPTIEPIYKNVYVKANMSGDFTVINEYLIEELKQLNLWNPDMMARIKYYDGSIQHIPEIPQNVKDKYKEVFEIHPSWLIKCAANRGKWIDQSQSLNVYYNGTSGKELSDVYFLAWTLGLKTTYYLRTLGASQIEKSTIESQNISASKQAVPSVVSQEGKNGQSPQDKQHSQPVASQAFSPVAPSKDDPKLCKINDPDCEACQ